jgi:cytidine deaminase
MTKPTIPTVIANAKNLIRGRYQPGRHHTACALVCDEQFYFGLHIDHNGLDACAEPSALSEASLAGHTEFDLIVTAHWTGEQDTEPTIIAPCGNCAQMLNDFAPNILVIVPDDTTEYGFRRVKPAELLPYAYQKPT